jgi:hypothetical protein
MWLLVCNIIQIAFATYDLYYEHCQKTLLIFCSHVEANDNSLFCELEYMTGLSILNLSVHLLSL